jgi:hypothetical protein
MKKLEISQRVEEILKAIGGVEWLKANAKPWSMGYGENAVFFAPRTSQGLTCWLSAAGEEVAVELREFRGLKGVVVVERFECGIDRLKEEIEAKVGA